jgi:hypothetical protein
MILAFPARESSFDIAQGGIKIEWRGDSDDDIHSPVMGSVASIEMLVPVSNTTLNTFVDEVTDFQRG